MDYYWPVELGNDALIIAFRSRFSPDKLYATGMGLLWMMAVCCVAWLGWSRDLGEMCAAELADEEGEVELVVAGALGLKESERSSLGLALEDQLVVKGVTSRPGMKRAYWIGLRGSEAGVRVGENETVNLKVDEKNRVSFEGPLRIVVQGQDDGSVALLMEGEKVVLGREEGVGAVGDIEDLKGGKLWGHDLFYRSYGGGEYGQLGRGAKIELEYEGKPYFVYVAPGEFLTKKDGVWVCGKSDGPVAMVKEMGPDLVEVEAWDAEGFSVFKGQWRCERRGPFQMVADQLITGMKLRTAKQISCKIGGKRFLVKPGDWIIKGQTGWHKLVSVEEIEAYLAHRMRGELIVFDDVDPMGRVKGHVFDSMRTQVQSFTLQAMTSKKKEKKSKGAFKK